MKKGFTMLELIIVIVVVGILVLLASPKLVGYVGDAKEANIKNDVKAYENYIETKLSEKEDFTKDWNVYLASEIEEIEIVYDHKGKTRLPENKEFKEPKNIAIDSKLKGKFLYDEELNKIYYYESNLASNGNTSESEDPEPAGPMAEIEVIPGTSNTIGTLKMIPLIEEPFDLRGVVHSHEPLSKEEVEQLIISYKEDPEGDILVLDTEVNSDPRDISLMYDGYYNYFVKKGNRSEVHHYKNVVQKYIVGSMFNRYISIGNDTSLNSLYFWVDITKKPLNHLLVNNGLDVVDIEHPDNNISIYAIPGHNLSIDNIKNNINFYKNRDFGYLLSLDVVPYPYAGGVTHTLTYNTGHARQHSNFSYFVGGSLANMIEVGPDTPPIYNYKALNPGQKFTLFAYREDLKNLNELQETDSDYFLKIEYTHQ